MENRNIHFQYFKSIIITVQSQNQLSHANQKFGPGNEFLINFDGKIIHFFTIIYAVPILGSSYIVLISILCFICKIFKNLACMNGCG